VRPWLAFVSVSAVPFVVIAVCNSLIVGALVVRRRKALHAVRASSGHAGDKNFVQLAVMCVAASGLFLVCSLPSIILLIGKPYWNVPPDKNPAYQVCLSPCSAPADSRNFLARSPEDFLSWENPRKVCAFWKRNL